MSSLPHDCRRCGVCCFSSTETYVRVDGDDWSRLGLQAERVAHFIGHRAFMRMQNGHCAALDVRRCSDGTYAYLCSIYDLRPRVCRELDRGSPECEGELLRKAEQVWSDAARVEAVHGS